MGLALLLLLQDPTLEDVLARMKERAVKSGVARATLMPEVYPLEALHDWPDSSSGWIRAHHVWDLESLDDGGLFLVHEQLNHSIEDSRVWTNASWTLLRPRRARALVRTDEQWTSHAFVPRGELPDPPTEDARIVLYTLRPDLLPILEPGIKFGTLTEERIELVAGSRSLFIDRRDHALVAIETRHEGWGGLDLVLNPWKTTCEVKSWVERAGVRLPAALTETAEVRYSEKIGDAKRAEAALPEDMLAVEFPLATPDEYRARLAKNADDVAASYGLLESTEAEHRLMLRRLVDAGNSDACETLEKERLEAYRKLARGPREAIGAILTEGTPDAERLERGSLALRLAHVFDDPDEWLAKIPLADLPVALQNLRRSLQQIAVKDAGEECAKPLDGYLFRLRYLARERETPRLPEGATLAHLLFGDADARLKAAMTVREGEALPYAIAAAWASLTKEPHPSLDDWLKGLPPGLAPAFRWRMAVLDGGDHAAAARVVLASFADRRKWPSWAGRFMEEAAAAIVARYDVGKDHPETEFDLLELADFLIETELPWDREAARYAAKGVAGALLHRAEGHERLLRLFMTEGVEYSSGRDSVTCGKFINWAFSRLKESGTRDELVAFAKMLAGDDGAKETSRELLHRVLDHLVLRYPEDEEIREAAAVREIEGSAAKAMGMFAKLLESSDPERRATALVGIAECVVNDPLLKERALALLDRAKAERLGNAGFLVIANALSELGAHDAALEWGRAGVELSLKAKPSHEGDSIEDRSVFHVALGHYLEGAGRLEDAFRSYKRAVVQRALEGRLNSTSWRFWCSGLFPFGPGLDLDFEDPVQIIRSFYRAHGSDVFVKRALGGKLPPLEDEKAARVAMERLKSDSLEERDEAAAALKKMGLGVLAILKDGLDSADAELRARVLEIARELTEPRG